MDSEFYNAAIEPLANGNGIEALFMVEGNGICMQMNAHTWAGGWINFNIGVPTSFYNKVNGILGHFNGSQVGELYPRNDMDNPIKNPHYQSINMESCELLRRTFWKFHVRTLS